jgi:glycosyltransferase involved in cell wall biosynthesis
MSGHAPLRVLQLCAPARAGGLETVVRQLAVGLRAQDIDAQVAVVLDPAEADAHPFAGTLEMEGVPVHRVVVGGRGYRDERAMVARIMGDMNAQVLHTHGYRCDVIDGPVARQHDVRHAVTLHGFTARNWRGRLYEWIQVRAAARADAVIVVSKVIERRVRAAGGDSRVHLLRNAMRAPEAPADRDTARRILGVAGDLPVIGWVGRLSREKGPDLLLDAVARLRARAQVVVIGDGPMRSLLAERARALGLDAVVSFAGLHDNAARLFAAFDVLALTSRTEGTPMVLLEAMWAGVPIVATRVGGVPDILDDASAHLPTTDPLAIAAALDAALAQPTEGMLRSGRALERVQHDHDLQSWIAAHADIYRRIISSGATS